MNLVHVNLMIHLLRANTLQRVKAAFANAFAVPSFASVVA